MSRTAEGGRELRASRPLAVGAVAVLVSLFACTTENDAVPNACGTHEIPCGGACVAIDNLHCGNCGACTNGLDCVPTSGAANGYACGCVATKIRCDAGNGSGDTCMDPHSEDHCGHCGNICDQGDECKGDWSEPLDKTGEPPLACLCRAPSVKCGNQCVDVQDGDTSNCGACGKRCASGEECIGGACFAAE